MFLSQCWGRTNTCWVDRLISKRAIRGDYNIEYILTICHKWLSVGWANPWSQNIWSTIVRDEVGVAFGTPKFISLSEPRSSLPPTRRFLSTWDSANTPHRGSSLSYSDTWLFASLTDENRIAEFLRCQQFPITSRTTAIVQSALRGTCTLEEGS